MLCSDVHVDIGAPSATQEGVVYVLGKEVDVRTSNIVYPITLRSTRQGRSWTVLRSFAEAEALNDLLRRKFKSLPPFPRKRHISHFFMYSEKIDYWNALRDGLQEYFTALVSKGALCNDPDLQSFLQPVTLPPPLIVTLAAPRKCRAGTDYEYPVTVSNEHLKPTYKLDWCVTRCHSEFVAFDELMRTRFPDKDLPEFPRKRHISQFLLFGSEAEWYRVQGMEIQAYLTAILSDQRLQGGSVLEDPCIRDLLEISDAKLRIASRTCQSRGSTTSRSSVHSVEPYVPHRKTKMSAAPVTGSASSPPAPSPVHATDEVYSGSCGSRLAGCCSFVKQSFRPERHAQEDLLRVRR